MCISPLFVKGNLVSCGQCMECSIQKSNEWAFRIVLEASLYENNCVLTLTYNNENLPKNGSLDKRDLQNFIKDLRYHLEKGNKKIRYFACGEYGSDNEYINVHGKVSRGTFRPHYHIIIFNYDPSDKYYFFTDKKGNKMYRSPFIEKIWKKGNITVGQVDLNTAKYCAIYLQKKHFYKDKGLVMPFTLMSKKPGLGVNALKSSYLKTDKIYLNGKFIKLPRYYLDVFSRNGFNVSEIKDNRKNRAFSDFKYNQVFFNGNSELVVNYDVFSDYLKKRRERFERIFSKSFFEKR